MFDTRRLRTLDRVGWKRPYVSGAVVYWMGREQRITDNWALYAAAQSAHEHNVAIHVVFVLPPEFISATKRHYHFLIQGLREIESELQQKGIDFSIRCGNPVEEISRFVHELNVGAVFTDCNPLRLVEAWKHELDISLTVPFYEIDAHNIVPIWVASDKQETWAYTLRPKLQKLLPEFLKEFDPVSCPKQSRRAKAINWKAIEEYANACGDVAPITWCTPGSKAAEAMLQTFITTRLANYDTSRNNPLEDGQSDLSPYLHFGQLSPQRVALAVLASDAADSAKSAFLEQLIIRRELSDNFTFYNPNYDSLEGAPQWARRSLLEHEKDTRSALYSYEALEAAATHDVLWNACQRQLLRTGKIHGYMRMYWAKQVLLWKKTAAEAVADVVRLNDTYSIDGNDPNGYVGILWSLAGLHDRPWYKREIYGLIRPMTASGISKKFDTTAYIRTHSE